jgi:hypothetical protein
MEKRGRNGKDVGGSNVKTVSRDRKERGFVISQRPLRRRDRRSVQPTRREPSPSICSQTEGQAKKSLDASGSDHIREDEPELICTKQAESIVSFIRALLHDER